MKRVFKFFDNYIVKFIDNYGLILTTLFGIFGIIFIITVFIIAYRWEDYSNGIINIYNNTGEVIATYENIENLHNCGDGVISFYCDGEKYYYCNCSMEIITNEEK